MLSVGWAGEAVAGSRRGGRFCNKVGILTTVVQIRFLMLLACLVAFGKVDRLRQEHQLYSVL